MFYTNFNTAICEIILAGDDEGLKYLHLSTGEGNRHFEVSPEWQRNDEFFTPSVTQINEYLSGSRTDFNIKLAPEGTVFQKQVWQQLQLIPYGETRSYGEVASQIGRPGASRAVGAANGRNPIPLIVPCHRVIGAGGELTGFAHGLKAKKLLLELEKNHKAG